jgi:mannose-6-phosphate isomerase-like protein (cupin superfamily)
MKVQTCVTALALALAWGATAFAQSAATPTAPPPVAIRTFTSSAELTEMLARADRERKPEQAMFLQPVVALTPYLAQLESRVRPTPPQAHVTQAEIVVVVDGSATLIVGGALVDAKPNASGANIVGTAIAGGAPMKIAKGDWVMVPENTPHWFQTIDGKLSIISLHVPRGQKPN